MHNPVENLLQWANDLLKGEKPPKGYTPAPESKVGAYRKLKVGGGYHYWKPGIGKISSADGKLAEQAIHERYTRAVSEIKQLLAQFSRQFKARAENSVYPQAGRAYHAAREASVAFSAAKTPAEKYSVLSSFLEKWGLGIPDAPLKSLKEAAAFQHATTGGNDR